MGVRGGERIAVGCNGEGGGGIGDGAGVPPPGLRGSQPAPKLGSKLGKGLGSMGGGGGGGGQKCPAAPSQLGSCSRD